MFKHAVRGAARALGVEISRYSAFARAVDMLAACRERPFFVQIGANNGTDFDDLYATVVRNRLPGIVVEPIADYFEALCFAYSRHKDVRPIRAALHPTETEMRMYRADPAQVTKLWQHGVASFSRDHLLAHGVPEAGIWEETVPAMSFDRLVADHVPAGTDIAILAVDTEGFDAEVLAMVDFSRHRPEVIRFESVNLDRGTLRRITSDLSHWGYHVMETPKDCIVVSDGLTSRIDYLRRAARFGRNP